MKLGYLTSCLPKMTLENKLELGKSIGFEAMELACWPRVNDRDYAASDIDVQNLTPEKARAIRAMFDEAGIEISSIAYYDNNLDHDLSKRAFVNEHTKRCIDAAALLGVDSVGTFAGRNIDKSIKDNFDEFQYVFTDLLDYAALKGVRVIIENCPMIGWQRAGEPGTISFTGELWEEMFRRVPHENFGLNYDPSHLVHMLMDYLPLIEQFKDRIFHVHAKDAHVNHELVKYYGVYNAQLGGPGWWQFKMPGRGDVDFRAMFDALRKIGYDGVVSIEHEDKEYEGTEELVAEGLRKGYAYIRPLLP